MCQGQKEKEIKRKSCGTPGKIRKKLSQRPTKETAQRRLEKVVPKKEDYDSWSFEFGTCYV